MRLRLAGLALSIGSASVGAGWWVHPGAGLLLAGCSAGALALLWDDGAGGESS